MVLFLHNTSRVDDEPYPNLLGEKGGTGFPTLVFMDEEGNVLAKQGARNVKAFTETYEMLDAWRTMKARFEAGDASVGAELLLAELRLGQIAYPEARERRAALQDLGRRQARELHELLAAAESAHVHASSKTVEEAGPRLLEMREADRIPTGRAGEQFFKTILQYASARKDPRLFQQNLVEMKRRYGRERNLRAYFEQQDVELARLRRGG